MSVSRTRALVVTLLTAAATFATTFVAAGSASAALPDLAFSKAIESLAPYQGQTTCSPTVKVGTGALRAFVMKAYPGTADLGITRACSVGGQSEHKEGRAWDWGVRYSNTSERTKAYAFLTWLRKTDKYGNTFANARRLGVMYVIWNRQIWSAYNASAGWRPYTGADPHTSHVHISLSWAGAKKLTSFWTKGTPYVFPPTGGSGGSGGDGAGTGNGDGSSSTVRYPEPQPVPQPNPVPSGPALENELITLPATYGSGLATKGVLQAGEKYKITVTGSFGWGGGSADAECSTTRSDSTWRRQRSIVTGQWDWDTLDAYLNGHDIQGQPTVDNGRSCNPTNHTYTWEFQSDTTDHARLRIWDPTTYGDNTGKLVARIIHQGATTPGGGPGTGDYVSAPVAFTVDSASANGSGTAFRVQAGHSYDVTLSGSFDYGPAMADAECATTATDSTWRRSRDWGITTGDQDLLDLKLGDGVDPIAKSPSGADCDGATHTYIWRWTPDHDQQLKAFVYDTNYSDNNGLLTVNVVPV
ncbi:MAG: hypothetical protein QOJ92_1149 [Frankiales bacterium]|nr:hypothetical protein [Frankiales bacterium]